MPFVSKANGNPVLAERPELLDKPVIKFTLTLAREKGLDGFAASHELGSVAPPAVYRVCERHAGRIARVPCTIFAFRALIKGPHLQVLAAGTVATRPCGFSAGAAADSSSSNARALSAITHSAPASSMTSFNTSRPAPDRYGNPCWASP